MTDHRDPRDPSEPDPDADRWSAWLPPLDTSSDHTGAAATPHPSQPTQPLPQRSAPQAPPPPAPAHRVHASYRSAPPPPATSWGTPPKSHLLLAIVSVIFGFTLFGIIAIVKAASVNSLFAQGRIAQAQRASRLARNWAMAAFVVNALMFVTSVIPTALVNGF